MIKFRCNSYQCDHNCRNECEILESDVCCVYCKRFATCKQHCNLDDYHCEHTNGLGLTGQMLKLFVMKKQIRVLPVKANPELEYGTET